MKPKVSVVLPTYNRADKLLVSAKSVLNQTFADLELIIVNDGSDDNTDAVVDELSDNRVTYIKNSSNVGGGQARNIGINEAKGDWVAFQDSDDEWLIDKLAICMSFLEEDKSLSGCYSRYIKVFGENIDKVPSGKNPAEKDGLYEALLWDNLIGTPSAIMLRSALLDVGGFDPSLARFQDWDIFIRLSKKYKIGFVDQCLLVAYYSNIGITSNDKLRCESLELIYEKNRFAICEKSSLSAHWLSKIGGDNFMWGDVVLGRKKLLEAFLKQPFSTRHMFKFIVSLFGSRFLFEKARSVLIR